MKRKKLITCLTAMILTALLISGCGSDRGASGQSHGASSSAQTTPAVTQAPAAAEKPAPTKKPSPSAAGPSTADSAPASGLTVDDAKKIAFDEAQVAEEDVVLKKAELSMDDGISIYEVEFYYNDYEYSYDIDSNNGMIRDVDRDRMDPEDYREMEALMKNSTGGTTGETDDIDEEKAFEIALEHANVSASDISRKEVHPDYDDVYGREIYEVEFHVGQMEYNYDIDAETGEILEDESEIDD